MPRAARKKSASGIYHVMLRGADRRVLFYDDEDNERFLDTLRHAKEISGFKLYAYCLMGNHVHLLIEEGAEPLELVFKRIGSSYVYYYNWKYELRGHLLQDRFRSECVENDAYFLDVLRYICQNPSKAGLCVSPFDYPWLGCGSVTKYPTLLDGVQPLTDMRKESVLAFVTRECTQTHLEEDVYNRLTDLICNNQSTDLNAPKYVNSGNLKIAGIEMELGYNIASFRSRLSTTMQYALSAEQYYYDDHHIYSVPWYIASLTCEQRLLNKSKQSLWLSGNLRYSSRTLNKANSRIKDSEDFHLSGNALIDLRLKYNYNNMLQLSLDCENIFNTIYEIGGTSYLPYQYPGRILMGTVSFKL